MSNQPSLETNRLLLRPFSLNDAAGVQRLAGDYDVASTTLRIPHPYEDGIAEQWIETHATAYAKGNSATFAIELKSTREFVGGIALVIFRGANRGELGYWVGKPYWGQGICTEATRAVLGYAFNELKLNRVSAEHMTRNPGSGRVMQKVGMKYEGTLRQNLKKWDRYEDMVVYGILSSEFSASPVV